MKSHIYQTLYVPLTRAIAQLSPGTQTALHILEWGLIFTLIGFQITQ